MGQLATSKLVGNWFIMKRGTALGIAATGISVSGVIMPAVSALIIAEAGWRQGFIIYGLITWLVVVPIVLKMVISRPEEKGLLPDGAAEKTHICLLNKQNSGQKEFLTNKVFWFLTMTIGLLFCIQKVPLIHMVPRLTDQGMSLVTSYVTSTTFFGILGKVVYGMLVDRWDAIFIWLSIAFR